MLKKRLTNLFLFVFLTSCGFSAGLYTDILEAQDHISKRDYKKAAQTYESILKKKPPKTVRVKINFQLGDVYSIYLNDYENSIRNFQTIVEDSNEPSWQIRALEKLGNIYFNDLKKYNESEKIYKRLESFYPKLENSNFYSFRKGLSKFHNRQYIDAIKVFDKITKLNDKVYSTKSFYYLGLSFFYLKEYETAIKYLDEYIGLEKREDLKVDAKFLIANAYESSENLKRAYDIYYSILGSYPNTEVIKERLNSLYERRIARKRWKTINLI